MAKHIGLGILLFAVTLSAGCASARRTGSTIRDGTVAAGQQIGDATADATITSAVKMKFAKDETVDALDINVDTTDGNVTLTGDVATQTEADQAVALAKGVEGVKSVTPRLKVANP